MIDTIIEWHFVEKWTLSAGARVPFFTRAVGGQLNTPAIGVLTVSRPFDLIRR